MTVTRQLDNINIRQADIEDAAVIAELSGELGYPSSHAQTVSRLGSILDIPEHKVYVAVGHDETVLGWIHVFISQYLESDPFAELGGLVVSANWRAKGIGKKLMVAAESWVAQKGVRKMKIRSRSSRVEAHAFYKSLGYGVAKTQYVFEKSL
jgi:GNAT superfamily N-acetyltransferase